jgi:hypothetical protein
VTDQDSYVRPPRAYEHVSYWLVFCGNGCGAWLSGEDGSWSSTTARKYAAKFPTEEKAWQAAMAAGWANVPLPGHDPHKHGPYGPGEFTFYCSGNGANDCDEVRSYKDATVCPACRRAGWVPW